MTEVIQKISINGQVYPFAGGSSSTGEEHEVITQAAYDALTPTQKAEKVYMIKESGTPAPVGPIEADSVEYDNTTSGLTATNVQDAIDEVDGKFGAITGEGTPVNNGDFIGQMYKDTISGNMYIWNGSVWGSANSIINGDYSSTANSFLVGLSKQAPGYEYVGITEADCIIFFHYTSGRSSGFHGVNNIGTTYATSSSNNSDTEYRSIFCKKGKQIRLYAGNNNTYSDGNVTIDSVVNL